MGVRGLSRWLAASGCNQDLNKHSILSSVPTDHLCIDMNCVMHQAYNSREPSLRLTLQRTVARTREIILKFKPLKSLTVVFDGAAPLAKLQTQRERRMSYAVIEQETMPQHQRPQQQQQQKTNKKNLRANSEEDDTAANGTANDNDNHSDSVCGPLIRADSDRPLSEAEITTGSPYIALVEEAVTALIVNVLTKQEEVLSPSLDVLISRSCDIGEGELKISMRLQTLQTTLPTVTTPHDTVVLFSSDSDMVLVGVAAVNFVNIWVIHPSMSHGTSVGMLLLKWVDSKASDSLSLDQLPSARIDFVFLMNLAGGDFYSGLDEGENVVLWNRYRHWRCTDKFVHRRLVRLEQQQQPQQVTQEQPVESSTTAAAAVSVPTSPQQQPQVHQTLTLDAELFAHISGKPRDEQQRQNRRGGGGSSGKTPNQRMKARQNSNSNNSAGRPNPAQGANLASFALWSVEQVIMGRCVAMGVQPALTDRAVPMAALQSFASNPTTAAACRPRRTVMHGFTGVTTGCERPPLFTFVAVSARTDCLPTCVQRVLEENPALKAKLSRVTSSPQLAAVTDEILALVRASNALSPNATATVPLPPEVKSLLDNPDPSVVGFHLPSRTVVKKSVSDFAAIVANCMEFKYVAGTEVRFRGVARSDISAIVAEPRVVKVKEGDKQQQQADDDDDDDDASTSEADD